MFTELPFPFSGRIYRSAMPFRSFHHLDQIWSSYQEHEIDLVVVLLEKAEIVTYAQRDLISLYRQQGMDVLHLPIPDHRLPPDIDAFQEALGEVSRRAKGSQNVVVHCLAGIGRTGTFLACLARQEMDLRGEEAIRWVRKAVPGAVENEDQEQFVLNYSHEVER